MRRLVTILAATFAGVLIGLFVRVDSVSAISFVRWDKRDVIPIVLVKPYLGSFAPVEGFSLTRWNKDEVTPVCLLKPGIVDFVPAQGSSIGISWGKDDVNAMVLTKPTFNDQFKPVE
jgi:hypothetical protein